MARAKKSTPAKPSGLPEMWPHQKETLSFADGTPYVYDASDPGTGKTRSQIEIYRKRKNRKRWLIVCPKTLMHTAWGADIEKYAPELTVSYATAANRDQAFEFKTDVVIINTDGVKMFTDKKLGTARLKYLREFDHLTIDEATTYKHASSQRSKAMLKVSKAFAYRNLLSGTPNANSVMELWHQMMILDGGKRLGNSYFKLRGMIQVPTQIGPRPEHVRWDDKPGAATAVNELLRDVMIRHSFEEVMTHVPPNHRDMKGFDLSPKAKKAYDKMALECILELKDETITAVHAASLRTKLLQIASGAVYNGGEDSAYSLIDTGRYELIAELVENRPHSVVFFNWKHQREELGKMFSKKDISYALIDGSVKAKDRDQIVADYQDGKYQTILLHPRTGAHGLTLTRGTTTIVSSPIYEADLLKQAIHRIYRGAQNQVTNTILVKANGTVEQKVYDVLLDKEARMVDFLELVESN